MVDKIINTKVLGFVRLGIMNLLFIPKNTMKHLKQFYVNRWHKYFLC